MRLFASMSSRIKKYSKRSAPASPSHMGLSGLVTPDSLSREGSPILEILPDVNMGSPVLASHSSNMHLQQTSHDFKNNPSAPGSPGKFTHSDIPNYTFGV